MPTKPFAVRLRAVERKALELLAEANERQPGDMIRFLVRAEAKRSGLWACAELLVQGEGKGEHAASAGAPTPPQGGPTPVDVFAHDDDDDLGYDESALSSGSSL